MSTYTCPHCGQHDLSTQRRHNCPKPPSLSIPLGPPRSRDPIANEYIARLTRELEEARERERQLRAAVLDAIRRACRCEEYYRAIEREDPQCQAHDIEDYVEQVFEAAGMVGHEANGQSGE